MRTRKYTKLNAKLVSFAIIFLGMIMLFSVGLIRQNFKDNNSFIGYDFYHYYRLAEISQNNTIQENDILSYGGRPFAYQMAWPSIISFLSKITGLSLTFVFNAIPIVLGFFTLILLRLLLNKTFKNHKVTDSSLLIISLSPPFIYFFSTNNPFSLIFFLSIASLYLLTFKNFIFSMLSMIFAISISYFSTAAFLFFSGIYLTHILIFEKKKFRLYPFYLLLGFTIVILNFFRRNLGTNSFENLSLGFIFNIYNFDYNSLFSDFGGKIGLSIFSIALLLIGFYVLWQNNKYKYLYVYLGSIIMLVLAIFFEFILFYVNILIAVIGSFGIIRLMERKWESDFIKTLSIFIIISGLVFSGLSFVNTLSSSEPTKAEYDSLMFLKSKSFPIDTILSDPDKGFWFNYINRKNFMDNNIFFSNEPEKRYNEYLMLMGSSDLEYIYGFLDKYSIDYIFLDSSMIDRYFNRQDINFYYQLKYNPQFQQIYKFKNFENGRLIEIQIWRYKKL